MGTESWVYFLQEGDASGPIKIGTTTGNPHARRRRLQTGNSKVLTLLVAVPGTRDDEQALHERFASLRIRSEGEFFRFEPVLAAFVDGAKAAHDQPKDDGSMADDQLWELVGRARMLLEVVEHQQKLTVWSHAMLESVERELQVAESTHLSDVDLHDATHDAMRRVRSWLVSTAFFDMFNEETARVRAVLGDAPYCDGGDVL